MVVGQHSIRQKAITMLASQKASLHPQASEEVDQGALSSRTSFSAPRELSPIYPVSFQGRTPGPRN